jgi:uncharacterized protein YktB (UPF0637 family)
MINAMIGDVLARARRRAAGIPERSFLAFCTSSRG